MKAVVVYESMYGNTHEIASRIGEGLRRACDKVDVVAVADATPSALSGCQLLVVGGPTHVHGMTSKRSRDAAREALTKSPELVFEPSSTTEGLREWFDGLEGHGAAAAFDTRIDAASALTGRASRAIARRLRRHRYELVVPPESFLVDRHNQLVVGEAARAVAWGRALAAATADRTNVGAA
jgi:hypothetical protein